jgi:hypothetical protein
MNKNLLDLTADSVVAFSPSVGEHVGLEAGAKMVKSFYDAHPDQANGYLIGREIVEKILAQPGCVGLSIHPAYNEDNVSTLVFSGVDIDGQQILKYSVIGQNGNIEIKDGLIVDHITTIPGGGSGAGVSTYSWF